DRRDVEGIARRMRIGAEREHLDRVAALGEEPPEPRHVHRRAAQIGREDGRGDQDAHGPGVSGWERTSTSVRPRGGDLEVSDARVRETSRSAPARAIYAEEDRARARSRAESHR